MDSSRWWERDNICSLDRANQGALRGGNDRDQSLLGITYEVVLAVGTLYCPMCGTTVGPRDQSILIAVWWVAPSLLTRVQCLAYLDLFHNLQSCGDYPWGAPAFTYLYDHMGHMRYHATRKLEWYMTLLHVRILKADFKFIFYKLYESNSLLLSHAWIFEHFSTQGMPTLDRGVWRAITLGYALDPRPEAMIWYNPTVSSWTSSQ